MKTLLDVLQRSTDYLGRFGIASPRRQAENVISDALGINRVQLYLEFDRPLIDSELEMCRERIVRCGKKEPVQYIHGEVEFFDCTFKVTPAVLIPRQETEILVDKIAAVLAKESLAGKVLWDVCCGSGCIGISLKNRFPELQVILSDFSQDALKLAYENAQLNEVDVSFKYGDLLQPFEGQRANYFVCNPPYVTEAEYSELEDEVRRYEPRLALVGGKSGLEFYERLALELPSYLEPESKVWFEMGCKQGSAIQEIFSASPWKAARLEQDWSAKDRFFFLEIE
jgi:release factor glutamine methyltransferase